MRINWYYRLLLSYTPIFFFVISSIIFAFFTTLNHASENRYIETNKAIVEQIMLNTEANLKLTELNAVSALITDPLIKEFFYEQELSIFNYYEIQKQIINMKTSFPFASSVYLYNEDTGQILSDSNAYNINNFSDRDFLLNVYHQSSDSSWSKPRDYTLSTIDRNKQKVVSLIKTYQYDNSQQGAMIINVYLSSLTEFLNQFEQKNRGTVFIMDDKTSGNTSDLTLLSIESEYTGWTYFVSSVNTSTYSILSIFSNIWWIFVLLIIILAIIWFTLITHINYKPIQTLVKKINTHTFHKSDALGIKKPLNEFNIINSAIDHLLQKSVDYDTLHEADAMHRKRMLVQEILVGNRILTDAQWKTEAKSLQLPINYNKTCVVSIEIDQYNVFLKSYKSSDQHLLKYILENSYSELAQKFHMEHCSIWSEPQKMTFILFLSEHHLPYKEKLFQLCKEYRSWINSHLHLTVSIGIGTISDGMERINESYRVSCNYVSYKAAFGTNSIIDQSIVETKSDKDVFVSFSSIPEIVHLLKNGNHKWKEKLSLIIDELKAGKVSKAELTIFSNSVMQYMEKDISSLSLEFSQSWDFKYRHQFTMLAETIETLEQLHEQLEVVMDDLMVDIEKVRESSSNHAIAMRMKACIDANYTDPTLSLVSISSEFKLLASNASILFKKETGEKFVDYVQRVRLDHARRALLETGESIQSISEMVGYTHVLSFHRAFKKQFGFPPGEYREIHSTNR